MQASTLWDAAAALRRLEGSELWEECVLIHQKVEPLF